MREWLVIENTRSYGVFGGDVPKISGYLPRDAAEALLGRSLSGRIWFSREESEKMHAHPEWRNTEPN